MNEIWSVSNSKMSMSVNHSSVLNNNNKQQRYNEWTQQKHEHDSDITYETLNTYNFVFVNTSARLCIRSEKYEGSRNTLRALLVPG